MDCIFYKAPQLYGIRVTGSLGPTEYQNILEIVTCMIISLLSIYAQKNAPKIVGSVQGEFKIFPHVDRIFLDVYVVLSE